MLLDEISDTTLARLRVNANNRFICLPKICRIDRQIRHLPVFGFVFGSCTRMSNLLSFETLLDGILMRAREGREDEFTGIWVPWVDREIIALSHNIYDALNIAKIEIRRNPLAIKIESEINQVDISCSLPVSKEAAF